MTIGLGGDREREQLVEYAGIERSQKRKWTAVRARKPRGKKRRSAKGKKKNVLNVTSSLLEGHASGGGEGVRRHQLLLSTMSIDVKDVPAWVGTQSAVGILSLKQSRKVG